MSDSPSYSQLRVKSTCSHLKLMLISISAALEHMKHFRSLLVTWNRQNTMHFIDSAGLHVQIVLTFDDILHICVRSSC